MDGFINGPLKWNADCRHADKWMRQNYVSCVGGGKCKKPEEVTNVWVDGKRYSPTDEHLNVILENKFVAQ